jgi:hypothetical protein
MNGAVLLGIFEILLEIIVTVAEFTPGEKFFQAQDYNIEEAFSKIET